MLKSGWSRWSLAFSLIAIMLSGCGGGGGEASTSGTPVLQGSLTAYDFGSVTFGNFPAAKVVTLSNSGNATLQISNIALVGDSFTLDVTSGSNFCGSTTPTVAAGGSCAIAVGFSPTAAGDYSGTLSVSSNDPGNSVMVIEFTGTGVAVLVPTLQINRVEIDACPSTKLSIYLSVADQLGYPIAGLLPDSFSLTVGSEIPVVKTLDFVNTSLSVALVMDYSGSITDHLDVQAGMEEGVITFINHLSANDEAQIVKFDSVVEVVQPFRAGTAAGKEVLIAKVLESWDRGRGTRLNDAIYQAVDDLSSRSKDRRILILLSDGFDGTNEPDNPSIYSYVEARNYAVAQGVHVFPIGIAEQLTDLNNDLLDLLATETGGQYFDTVMADDLNTIYQQLAQTLFVDQYLLTCDSVFASGVSAILNVAVRLANGNSGEDSRTIVPCP